MALKGKGTGSPLKINSNTISIIFVFSRSKHRTRAGVFFRASLYHIIVSIQLYSLRSYIHLRHSLHDQSLLSCDDLAILVCCLSAPGLCCSPYMSIRHDLHPHHLLELQNNTTTATENSNINNSFCISHMRSIFVEGGRAQHKAVNKRPIFWIDRASTMKVHKQPTWTRAPPLAFPFSCFLLSFCAFSPFP